MYGDNKRERPEQKIDPEFYSREK